MKRSFYTFLLLLLFSCRQPSDTTEVVKFLMPTQEGLTNFLDKVRHIRLIPLNDSSLTYFGNDPDIFYDKQEFYVADKNGNGKVYRINDNGNLISIIGEKGRGPNEYLDIKNIQVEGDTVYIFSSPNITISKFLTDGSFISKNTIDINAQQAIVQDAKLIAYAGFGMEVPYRYIILNNQKIKYLLKSKEKVMSFSENTNVFYKNNKDLFAREAYSNIIYRYADDFIPYLTFDFGKYNIPDDFFAFGDSFVASEFLFKREYALTRKYFESDYMRVLETLVSTKNGPMFTYGFNMKNDDHQWIWFSMGDVRKSAFVNSLKEISENRLYFLLDPSGLEYLPNDIYNKILNKDVLNNTEENSNYIIAEFLINL